MKTKKILSGISIGVLACMLAGCGASSTQTGKADTSTYLDLYYQNTNQNNQAFSGHKYDKSSNTYKLTLSKQGQQALEAASNASKAPQSKLNQKLSQRTNQELNNIKRIPTKVLLNEQKSIKKNPMAKKSYEQQYNGLKSQFKNVPASIKTGAVLNANKVKDYRTLLELNAERDQKTEEQQFKNKQNGNQFKTELLLQPEQSSMYTSINSTYNTLKNNTKNIQKKMHTKPIKIQITNMPNGYKIASNSMANNGESISNAKKDLKMQYKMNKKELPQLKGQAKKQISAQYKNEKKLINKLF